MTNQQSTNGYFHGFIMGALIGATAVFFLGTKKGKRMARVLRQKGTRTLKDLEELVEEIEEKGEKFAKEAKVVAKKLEKQTRSGRKEITASAKKKLSHIQRLQQKGRAAAARYFQKQGKTLK